MRKTCTVLNVKTVAPGCTWIISEPPKHFSIHISNSPVFASPHVARVSWSIHLTGFSPALTSLGAPWHPQDEARGLRHGLRAFTAVPSPPSSLLPAFSVAATLTLCCSLNKASMLLLQSCASNLKSSRYKAPPQGEHGCSLLPPVSA